MRDNYDPKTMNPECEEEYGRWFFEVFAPIYYDLKENCLTAAPPQYWEYKVRKENGSYILNRVEYSKDGKECYDVELIYEGPDEMKVVEILFSYYLFVLQVRMIVVEATLNSIKHSMEEITTDRDNEGYKALLKTIKKVKSYKKLVESYDVKEEFLNDEYLKIARESLQDVLPKEEHKRRISLGVIITVSLIGFVALIAVVKLFGA